METRMLGWGHQFEGYRTRGEWRGNTHTYTEGTQKRENSPRSYRLLNRTPNANHGLLPFE